MTIRTKIIQWNESRTSCSPYNTNFWLPCICGKKPCIIGKTKKTSLHLLSLVFNASQYFGMEESNVNFKFSLKWQFQGYYFHTNDVANITVTEQNKNVTEEFRIMLGRTQGGNYAPSSPPYSAKSTKYSRSAFLGSPIQNQFYLHPILPHSVELWLISSTLTIWFSLNNFYWFVSRMLQNELWSTCLYSH